MTIVPSTGPQDQSCEVSELLKESVLTYKQFNILRGECVGRNVRPEWAQSWVMRAIVREDEISRWYWVSDHSVERDILECLESVERGSYPTAHYESLLRHVRRFLLTRYAFLHVRSVNKEIAAHLSKKRGRIGRCLSVLWLWKDLFLPRIALSLIIGYAVILGAGRTTEWLSLAASNVLSGWCLFVGLLVLIAFLVYLSVRTRIGSTNADSLIRRSILITMECITWAGVAAVIQNVAQRMLFHRHVWTWYAEMLTAEAALCVALLSQFFFGKSGSGSISEPL